MYKTCKNMQKSPTPTGRVCPPHPPEVTPHWLDPRRPRQGGPQEFILSKRSTGRVPTRNFSEKILRIPKNVIGKRP